MSAQVKFIETTSAKLGTLPIVEGRFTFTTDTKLLYRDTKTEHVCVSGSTDSATAITEVDGTMYITNTSSSFKVSVGGTNNNSLIFSVS
jgi:hypothetical protein